MDKILTLCAGGLIAGESALVLLHMNYPSARSWSTLKNILLAFADIALGSLLVFFAFFWMDEAGSWLLYSAAAVLIATHVYREAEYLAGRTDPFAATRGLFIFNNVRIALLLAVSAHSLQT